LSLELYLLTGYNGFYGQSRKPWVSLSTPTLIKELRVCGLTVHTADWHDLASGSFNPRDSNILYTFSQLTHIRDWLKDQLHFLAERNRLIPSLSLLLCHENKGYAWLYQKSKGIDTPRAWYLCDSRDIPPDLSYPVVLKTISGTNARGVFLCRGHQELLDRIKALVPAISPTVKLDHLRRRYLRGGRTYPGYPGFEPRRDADDWLQYMRPGVAFLLQEYISGLDCDYRVIAIGSKFYLMRRLTKSGDFRASGTKRFDFEAAPPAGLLDYARSIAQRFDTPFLSLDIGHKGGNNYLFEFQASHFGTAAIVRSQGYYRQFSGSWEFCKGGSSLEQTLAEGLAEYLRGQVN